MTTWRRLVTPTAVAFVVLYLAVMVINGAPPTQRQFVEFKAHGLLKTSPELIRRVELMRANQRLELQRQDPGVWIAGTNTRIAASAARQISTALEMMHNSGPGP